MSMYAICRIRHNFDDSDNHPDYNDDPPELFEARGFETIDDFIARLIKTRLDSKQILSVRGSYKTFHIDWIFEGNLIQSDVNITDRKEYLEILQAAKEIQKEREAKYSIQERASKWEQFERLKKELGET